MAGAQTFALTEPMSFELPCRSSDDATDDKGHQITINPDWSFTTPHDFDTERIAAAFGSRISCLDLERSIAAARDAMAYRLRRRPYPMRRAGRSAWLVHHVKRRFPSPITAANYVRSGLYAAEKHHVPDWQVDRIAARFISEIRGHEAPPKRSRNRGLVSEPDGLNRLWDAGIHPDDLPGIRNLIGHRDGPLSATLYIDIAYSGITPEHQRRLALAGQDIASAYLDASFRSAQNLSSQVNPKIGKQP